MNLLPARCRAVAGWLSRLRADLRERRELAAEILFLRMQLRLYREAEQDSRQRARRKQQRRRRKLPACGTASNGRQP
ncbi:MAG: hypothetical protein V1750_03685 [Acidobacteriota bacterium]